MVLSTSQQVALAFTAVLFTLVVLPKMFGVGTAAKAKESRLDPRYSRKGSLGGPAAISQPSAENIQQMRKLMEQEMKGDKFKAKNNNNNGKGKGYVFTLMPLYAIGVGVFAAYKFLKMKSSEEEAQKDKFAKGAKKSAEAENQLNELEQRLAQTERMLNSIVTQLDPLTNCAKSVAQEQKKEIMTQLQTIRYLMKKRGMDCPPLNEACFQQSLEHLIQTLGASETPPTDVADKSRATTPDATTGDEATTPDATGGDEVSETPSEEGMAEEEIGGRSEEESPQEDRVSERCDSTPSLGEEEPNGEESGQAWQACGLRRRNVPE
ncbi:uncharacterized protein LOC144181449 [Stigmatopora nigra]